ncbi:uncharacterized protein V1518DRAFT_413092 [Limtongia smithiae]|uniref:uncharacterized protein n=1 Tax=Limtongia smithiae TaxID=1125753 RepID=UPI0034CE40CF
MLQSQVPRLPHNQAQDQSTPGSSSRASASPEESNSGVPAHLRKIACVECRQQKVKCDAYERAPDACTRCVKRKLSCSVKSDFKRTYKRARMAAVEREVEELRRSLEMQHSEQDIVSRTLLDLARGKSTEAEAQPDDTAVNSGAYDELLQLAEPVTVAAGDGGSSLAPPRMTMGNYDVGNRQGVTTGRVPMSSTASVGDDHQHVMPSLDPLANIEMVDGARVVVTAKTIEGLVVTPEEIIALFNEYESHYHPFLPVVDLSRGPEFIYSKSDLLFWVILWTASRVYFDMQLNPLLSTRVKDFVARQLSLPLRTTYEVQAMLICTLWPPPTGSLNSDPCWSTCGLAMFNAVKLGLHCPGRTQDFGRVKVNPIYSDTQEQVRTWLACNVVSQLVGIALGYPTFVMYDWTVQTALRSDAFVVIPGELRTQVRLASFCDKMIRLLNCDTRDMCGNVDSATRRTVISVLAKELDGIESDMEYSASDVSKLLLHVTRVQLYAYSFLDDDLESNSDGLVLAYHSAIQAIALTETFDESFGPDNSLSKLLCLPLYLELDIVLAAFVILKLYFSSLSEILDTNAGKRHFASAIAIMRKASVKENDFPIRVSTIMFQLWKLHSRDRLEALKAGRQNFFQSPKLKLRSRMAPSVLFDSIWVWRERYGTFAVQPAGAGLSQAHPMHHHFVQQQQQQQQQQLQQQKSKPGSPRLRERQGVDGPQLRNAGRVIAMLDNTNPACGPTFEQQTLPLPPPALSSTLSSAGADTLSVLPSTGDIVQDHQQHRHGGMEQLMGTDELVNYLDNDAVAFDHLYLDWHEMGVLWDDISMFMGATDDTVLQPPVPVSH